MKKETHTISFRLDTHYLEALEKEASSSSLSIHEEARRIVIRRLEDTDRHLVLDEVKALREVLEHMRSDLAETLVTVLVEIGNVEEVEANRYVSAYLRGATKRSAADC
jgi:hypothetical protein